LKTERAFSGLSDGGTGKLWASHWNREYRSPFTRACVLPTPMPKRPRALLRRGLLQDVRALLQEFADA
jgi:hypothetical protein